MTSQASGSPFRGTAWYYARYRLPYPDELINHVIAEFHLDGRGHLLDVGCGPGTVALRLRGAFEEVVGIDADPEMIEEAHRQGEAVGAANARWLCMPAEEISSELGTFRLVTCGNALHWLDRDRVLQRCHDLLTDDGGIAILAQTPIAWEEKEPWQRELEAVLKKWLGDKRRAGAGERFEQTLARSSFRSVKCREHRAHHVRTVDSIIGHLYSTSFAARPLLGDDAPAFEQDVRSALVGVTPDGLFPEEVVTQSLLAWKR